MTDTDYLLLVKLLVRYGIKDLLLEIQRAVTNRPTDRANMRRVNTFYRVLTTSRHRDGRWKPEKAPRHPQKSLFAGSSSDEARV